MTADRIDHNQDGDLDDVFFSNASVHFEMMDDHDYALMISKGDRYVIINITDGEAYVMSDDRIERKDVIT